MNCNPTYSPLVSKRDTFYVTEGSPMVKCRILHILVTLATSGSSSSLEEAETVTAQEGKEGADPILRPHLNGV